MTRALSRDEIEIADRRAAKRAWKLFAWCVIGFCLCLIAWAIVAEVFAGYEFEREIGSFWSLSEKASSLDAKADYLNKFVSAIDAAHLEGNNAIFLKTPDNSFEQNRIALASFQKRMAEIRGMDVTSFAYQQAIQQITAQEQGEATNMLEVFAGCWYLKNHPMLWEWIDVVKWGFLICLLIGPIVIICTTWYEYE